MLHFYERVFKAIVRACCGARALITGKRRR